MRKNILLWGIIVLLISLKTEGEKQELASYQDKSYKFQFAYPKNWVLQADDAKKGYLALYSPDALAANQKYKTNELLCGIKIEILTLNKNRAATFTQMTNGMTTCFVLQKKKEKINQYCKKVTDKQAEHPYLFYILSVVKGNNYKTLIIAYIPEKEKKQKYKKKYDQIILSFKFLKNGS
ncbi:MAG: hypothetical protein GF365_01880 [Candidatus Buchananbacteria bacterium]|nr:hypothetical protein [Candidatus Buchananbacteria bacterium]